MERFVKGDVVVLLFPFSDLSASKKRPALVVANLDGDDFILCQITSENRSDNYSITLNEGDFKYGKLNVVSIIRPNKLFTANKSIIQYKACSVNDRKIKETEEKLVKILRS